VNATLASALAASVRPPGTVPLRLGASVYFDRVTPSATVSIDERIVSGFAALEQETPEAIVEWAAIDHETSGRRTRSDSWYAQLAYRLPFAARRFKPYARVDRTNVPADDPAFTRSTMHFAGRTGGIRIDVDPAAALKIEGRRERVADSRWMHTLAVQVSITFPGFRDSRQVPVGEGGHGEH
jgi:hypothetical protein